MEATDHPKYRYLKSRVKNRGQTTVFIDLHEALMLCLVKTVVCPRFFGFYWQEVVKKLMGVVIAKQLSEAPEKE